MTERLKLPASLILSFGSFPVWYWLCIWQSQDTRFAFALQGITTLLCAIAWLHKRLDRPVCEKSLLAAGLLARGIALGIGIGAYFLADLLLMQNGAIVTGAVLGLCYVLFWRMQHLPAGALLSVYAFILLGTAYFIGELLCFLQSRSSLGAVCLWMLGGTAMLFVIVRNLHMLLETETGRDTPRGYYRHNLALMLAFILPGAALMALGKPILAGLRAFLQWLRDGIAMLIRWMAVLVIGDDLIVETPEGAERVTQASRTEMWIGAIVTLLTVGAAAFLLIRFRSEIWDFLKQLVSDLLYTLQRLARLKAPPVVEEVHAEYTDRSELLEESRAGRLAREKRRRWRKRLREYRRTKAPAERFRMGYALWLTALQGWRTELTPQDTPAAIFEKSSGIPDPSLTGRITDIYYRVRYGAHTPDAEELALMDALVGSLQEKP